MRNAVSKMTAGLSLLASVGVAAAQTPTRVEPFPILRDARRVGPFLLDPGFTIYNFGFDDNIFLVPKEARAVGLDEATTDFVVRMGPDLQGQIRFGQRFALTFRDTLSGELFAKTSELNHWDNSFDGTFDAALGPVLLTTYASWATVKERPNSDVDARPRRSETVAGQGARFFLSPQVDLFGKVTRRRLRYSDQNDASISVRLDRDSDEFTGEVGWRANRGIRFFARRIERDDDFVLNGNPDSQDRRTLLGAELRPNAFLSGSLAVGKARLEPQDAKEKARTFDGTVFDANLVYRPTGSARVTFGARSDAYFSTYQDNLYYETKNRSVAVDWFLGSRWGVQAGWSKEGLSYPETSCLVVAIGEGGGTCDGATSAVLTWERGLRRDDITTVYGGVLFRMTGGFEIGLRLGKRTRDSNDLLAIDDQTFVTTAGSYTF
ncbi:MAG: outer membrane beta-barrel protein [Acidobacteriota bacterium]